ncbi:MAG: ATP-binding protein [Leptolyngbyaceae cyanobacterium MO_188.B28]|nr:ATP-binding protein [Leptolyngbyaceae cyanobacterium MO_188.B28]
METTAHNQAQATLPQLHEALRELKQTQLQLVQSEKMSSLGQLVAGIAHEINNPVGFIASNLYYIADYTQTLFHLLSLYQQTFPSPGAKIEQEILAADLDYIAEDLPKIIASMKTGTEHINTLTTSLRTFSRADNDTKIPYDLHRGIDSTLLILKHRLKANNRRPEIQVVKAYGDLPWVKCYAGQLNQVFMNLIANAIDALEAVESWRPKDCEDAQQRQAGEQSAAQGTDQTSRIPQPLTPTIRILTEQTDSGVIIRIADNGPGISTDVKERIFDYLFTTKSIDKGTGLGLSISRQIVVEKHGGLLQCISAPEQGTEFLIELPI